MSMVIGGKTENPLLPLTNSVLLQNAISASNQLTSNQPSSKTDTNSSTIVSLNGSQAAADNLVLYNKQGVIPVQSTNKADEEINIKSSMLNNSTNDIEFNPQENVLNGAELKQAALNSQVTISQEQVAFEQNIVNQSVNPEQANKDNTARKSEVTVNTQSSLREESNPSINAQAVDSTDDYISNTNTLNSINKPGFNDAIKGDEQFIINKEQDSTPIRNSNQEANTPNVKLSTTEARLLNAFLNNTV